MANEPEARQLGLPMTIALVVGNIIGAGVFLLPAALAPYGVNAVIGWLVTNVVALAVATWLFPGITLHGHDTGDKVLTLVVVGLIFGVITSLVKPVITFFSLPFIILTLGFLLLVINALMLLLTSKIAGSAGVPFHVDGFWTAVFASIVISIVSAVVGSILDTDRE